MSDNEISVFLTSLLIVMIVVLVGLVVAYVVIMMKTSNKKKKDKTEEIKTKEKAPTVSNLYNKQSIFDFMNFEKIEDNMIVRKSGQKYLMVIECQGVNYDLMSGLEKNSVEQGFLQFLNTLRYPIQIYVQTRTVNLESGLIKYKERVQAIRDRLLKKQMEYNRLEGLGYSKE